MWNTYNIYLHILRNFKGTDYEKVVYLLGCKYYVGNW